MDVRKDKIIEKETLEKMNKLKTTKRNSLW